MDYLKQMMIEHYSKSLEEWLEATPHLDPVEVKKVFMDLQREGGSLSIREIEKACRW